jgi:hypothetical protein
LVLALLTGCVSSTQYENMRERAQKAEALYEQQVLFTQGAHDDLAMLQRALIEQAAYINMLERGAMWQANEMARIVDTCEL